MVLIYFLRASAQFARREKKLSTYEQCAVPDTRWKSEGFFTCFGRDRLCPRTLRSRTLAPFRRGHVARLLEGQKDLRLPEVGEKNAIN